MEVVIGLADEYANGRLYVKSFRKLHGTPSDTSHIGLGVVQLQMLPSEVLGCTDWADG